MDALQLPQTVSGSRYVVDFMDYLTKINGQRPLPPQTKVRRPSFWWSISYANMEYHRNCCLTEVPTSCQVWCWISGIQKINTSAYHPQTDSMVEKFNHTLLEMIAKHAAHYRVDWDRCLGYVLFAYRVKPHDTTGRRRSIFHMAEMPNSRWTAPLHNHHHPIRWICRTKGLKPLPDSTQPGGWLAQR